VDSAKVNLSNISKKMELYNLAYNRNETYTQLLIKKGVNVNKRDTYRKTALYKAARSGNKAII